MSVYLVTDPYNAGSRFDSLLSRFVFICAVFVFLPLCCFLPAYGDLFAREKRPSGVTDLAVQAFSQTNVRNAVTVFLKGLDGLSAAEQSTGFSLLAAYEEHSGFCDDAAMHYLRAAELSGPSPQLLLHAVRAFISGGNYDKARKSLTRFYAVQDISPAVSAAANGSSEVRAAVYNVFISLGEGYTAEALAAIRVFSTKKAFSFYHPALLFTLWWFDADIKAKRRLLTAYPESPEAAVVHNNAAVLPTVFWYFLPRSTKGMQNFFTEQHKKNETFRKKYRPRYYQLGFYRTQRYAQSLMHELNKKHFSARIKTEKRASGIVYFVVYVEETTDGSIGNRLQQAGYEAMPVFSLRE